jgi:hypothetical protein
LVTGVGQQALSALPPSAARHNNKLAKNLWKGWIVELTTGEMYLIMLLNTLLVEKVALP